MPTVTPVNLSTQVTSTVEPQLPNRQKNISETPQVASPEVKPAQEDPLSPKLAVLARKEQALRQQMRAMQEKDRAQAALQAEIDSAKAWKAKLTQDPWSVMLEAGMTPEQATQVILNQPKPEDIQFQKLQQEIQSIKAAQDESLKRSQDAQKQQYEQAKKQISNEVTLLVDGDQSFETIKSMNAQEAVVELIEQTFNENGILMPIEEAAKEVEEYLAEEAWKLTQLKKVQARLQPQPPPAAQPQQKLSQAPQKSPPVQTLSNRMVQSTTHSMSAKERRERAILAFQGKL